MAKHNEWSAAARVGFRFVFCYFMMFALCCANVTIWEAVPFVGGRLEWWASAPVFHVARWVAVHWMHLTGPAATIHSSGFGDKALDWIACAVMVVVALVATLVWTALDRERREYRTLYTWMRYVLRLAIVASMFVYGGMKISPVQIGAPSLGVLNQTVGSLSRMTLLWTLLGLNPTYEMVCGVLEMAAGVLLLFKRTALVGALTGLVIMVNVVLFDVFFDIPVKLYAANLMLMIVLVIGPDMRAMLRFFFRHKMAAPLSVWTPRFSRPWMRYAGFAVEAMIVITIGVNRPIARHRQWAGEVAMAQHPVAWSGIWKVEGVDGAVPQTAFGPALTAVIFEPNGRLTLQAADGSMWGGAYYSRDAAAPVKLMLPPAMWTARMAGFAGGRMELEAVGAAPFSVLRLVRVATPERYFLYDAPYRLANEYGEEF